MKLISDKEIKVARASVVDQAYVKGCPNSPQEWFISTEKLLPLQDRAIAQAQLESCEKECGSIVEEIFLEMEEYWDTSDCSKWSGIVIHDEDWQAFKQDILKKVRGE